MPDRYLSIPVTKVVQPVGTFFTGSVDAYALLEICRFDFRRIADAGGHREFLGFQRKLDLKRVRAIERYIKTIDAVFPTAIVISVDERCASIAADANGNSVLNLQAYQDSETADFKIEYEDIASIIDGQHRMKAFEEVKGLDFQVNAAVFVGVDDATKADIFSTVNLAQTKVNKSLVYDLFSLQKSRSSEKTCHEIVVALDEMEESPFFERIKRFRIGDRWPFWRNFVASNCSEGASPIHYGRCTCRPRHRQAFWILGSVRTGGSEKKDLSPIL
jgi:DGQHR domain-containing protein